MRRALRTSLRLLLLALPLLTFTCQERAFATCTAITGYSVFSVSNVTNASGTPLATGQISILGTDINNNPMNYHVGATGGGVVMKRAVTANIVSGAVSGCVYIADSALTIPPSVFYHIQIKDTGASSAHNFVVDAPGVYITGANFVFDAYAFPSAPTLPAFAGGVVQGPLYVNSTVTATGAVTAPSLCLGTNCITAWPTGGSGEGGGNSIGIDGATLASGVTATIGIDGATL